MNELSNYAKSLVEQANKDARSKRNDWPGMPITSIPLVARGDMDAAINAGLVNLVTRPSKVNPGKTVTYLAPAGE